MNRAEIKEKFPDITDEQLQWLMDANGKAVNSAKATLSEQLKAEQEKSKELATKVDEFTAQKQSQMTKEEQLEEAIRQMQAKQAETQRGYNRMVAAKEFAGLNLSDDQLESVLGIVVSDDEAKTSEVAKGLAAIFNAQREDAVSASKKAAQTKSPKPQGGSGSAEKTVTKEQFDRMSYAERNALFSEAPDIYEQLNEE